MARGVKASPSIALLIPAHNEERVIADTIQGAFTAGLQSRHIYVVDDSSSDTTLAIAQKWLGERQVVHVERGGKALALKQAITHFQLVDRYDWVQIIDADSVFSPNYVSEISREFRPGVAAVCGQVKSLQNNWITSYRAFEYTIFQDFYKTLQSKFNLIGVMPGPATCFSTTALGKLDFSNDTLTEDFDLTIQVHHLRLGRIIYVPTALSWTQDPPTLAIYMKQVNRWYTGFFQVMRKHKVGRTWRVVDYMLLFQTFDGLFYAFQIMLLAIIAAGGYLYIDFKALFAIDFGILFFLSFYASRRMNRIDVLTPLPTYYVLRLVCAALFVWAALKVFMLPHMIAGGGVWNTQRIWHSQNALRAAMRGGESG